MNQDINEILFEIADKVLFIEKKSYVQQVADAAFHTQEGFFRQFNQKIENCETQEDKDFISQSAMTFLMNSLLKIIEISKENLKPGFSDHIISHISSRLKKMDD